MSKRICPVVIGVMALSGCTSSLPYFEPIVSPLETSFDSSSKSTLQTGNIVFRQTVDFPETTILLDKFTSPPTGTYQFEHDVPAGTVLHPGQLSSPEYSGPGYCTLTPTMKMKPLVGEQLFGFTCFADTDNSGTFDVYFSKGRLRQKSDNGEIRHKGQSGPGSTPLSGGFPDSPVKLSEALSYKIEEGANTDERFEIIIKFMPSHGFGAEHSKYREPAGNIEFHGCESGSVVCRGKNSALPDKIKPASRHAHKYRVTELNTQEQI